MAGGLRRVFHTAFSMYNRIPPRDQRSLCCGGLAFQSGACTYGFTRHINATAAPGSGRFRFIFAPDRRKPAQELCGSRRACAVTNTLTRDVRNIDPRLTHSLESSL